MSTTDTAVLSQSVYSAMTTPVASAKPTARPAPSRRSARGSPVRNSAPATIASAPPIATAVGCSPKIAIAPADARSGPLARDRVDQREISGAIAGRERREVEGLEAHRNNDEHERRPAELG